MPAGARVAIRLYAELRKFPDEAAFQARGFAGGKRYRNWLERAETLREEIGGALHDESSRARAFLEALGFLPGEVHVAGTQYATSVLTGSAPEAANEQTLREGIARARRCEKRRRNAQDAHEGAPPPTPG